MNVFRLIMQNFMSHKQTVLDFPKQGVVAVTGPNGAGKSSFVEAVAWGCWGKTLRGTPPWHGDGKPPCGVEVDTDNVQLERSRVGAKSTLRWRVVDEAADAAGAEGMTSEDPEYETATKSQEALETFLGCGFELWRKSHVFSSSDAAHFTVATDSERKRLIESFLGTNRFDPALEACRKDLKVASEELTKLQRQCDIDSARLDGARTRLDEAKKGLAASKPPEPAAKAKPGKPLSDYDASIVAAKREVTALTQKLRDADRAGAGWEQTAKQAHDLLDRLRGDTCPTCTQAITQKLRDRIKLDATAAKGKAEIEKLAANSGRAAFEATIEEINEEIEVLSKKRNERAQAIALERRAQDEYDRAERARSLLDKARRQADEDVFTLTQSIETATSKAQSLAQEVAELELCEKVLGVKGVRAHILGESLSGIEAVANGWLARLSERATIKLSPYSEKKTGGTSDSISLEVVGAGDGKGYKANSGGERRRLDVALLLAMAEVAAAAQGQEAGTLFFDEVFDCLDEDGITAVAEALSELASKRCVVIITHSKLMLEKLRGARRLHVEGGTARWAA